LSDRFDNCEVLRNPGSGATQIYYMKASESLRLEKLRRLDRVVSDDLSRSKFTSTKPNTPTINKINRRNDSTPRHTCHSKKLRSNLSPTSPLFSG
jgi:hypothetical protein